jgi:hypothetical protein
MEVDVIMMGTVVCTIVAVVMCSFEAYIYIYIFITLIYNINNNNLCHMKYVG